MLSLLQWVIPNPQMTSFALETYLMTLMPISIIAGIVLLVIAGRNRKLV